jgi:hypothetical protein
MLHVGDAAVDTGAVQSAVQRVIQWLTTGTHENWRGSNYAQWRSGAAAQLPAQQQQHVPLAQLPAALAAAVQQQQQQQVQEAAVAAALQHQQEVIEAQAAQLQAHIQAAMAPPEELPVAMQELAAADVAVLAAVAAAAPDALPAAQPQQQQPQQPQAGAALPRQAFVLRQLVAPTVAAAFDDHW